MRRILFAVIVGLGLVAATSPSLADLGQSTGCSSTTGAAVPGFAAPSCSIILACLETDCSFDIDVSVNGTGVVEGAVHEEPIHSEDTGSFNTGSGTADTLFCGPSAFSCTIDTDEDRNFTNGLILSGFARITCYGGGAAAVETVSCSFTQT